MTARSDDLPGPGTDTALDAIAWVRSVRDAMYADTATLSPAEFIEYVHRVAGTTAVVDLSGERSGARPA